FYAFAGTCLLVGLRQKGERYELLGKVALGIGMSMPFIFYANDAGWNVHAMMGPASVSPRRCLRIDSVLHHENRDVIRLLRAFCPGCHIVT
ncbi:MAG: hypothetical protein UHS51_06530, partial [Atopobiaceae bacterium]|nr:hypothetical protein [Atopobiaceae bacterium]